MDKQPPLAGLDPADLLRQGMAQDTLAEEASPGFTPPPPAELAPLFPQFEILGLIGQGGMGAVYKVRQKDLDRIVALKILPPAIGRSPEFSSRFTREARALAKLNHPGIVTIHEFGQQDGLYFILMEFVDGVSLAQLMQAGRIAPREALAIVPQICDALQYAHDQGIVHRDIKPENILLDRLGRVKVADFGIAKVVAAVCDRRTNEEESQRRSQTDATVAGKIIGTPAYMAPEQIDHPSEVDHRADIYALGMVFYQMLTGELPGKELEPPSRKVAIDVRLDEVVLRALEKKPELRYQQASILKTRVEMIAGDGAEQGGARSNSHMVRLVEAVFGTRLTSPLAIKFINLSALGFLGCLGFLGFVALPGTRPLFALWGLLGLFGLLGFAFPIERAHRRRQTGLRPDDPSVPTDGQPSRFPRMAISVALLIVSLLILLLGATRQRKKDHAGNTVETNEAQKSASIPLHKQSFTLERVGPLGGVDLDTGTFVNYQPTGGMHDPAQAARWREENGIDLILDRDSAAPGVLLAGTQMKEVAAEWWDEMSESKVVEAVLPSFEKKTARFDERMTFLSAQGPSSGTKTHVYRTLVGGIGILRLGPTQSAGGVRAEWRMLVGGYSAAKVSGDIAAPKEFSMTQPAVVAEFKDAPLRPQNSATASAPAFGPVIERVVNDDRPGATDFLIDLDTGRLVTPPSPKEADWNWTVTNGIDAIGCTDENVRGMVSTGGTVVVPVASDAWEKFSVSDVRQIVIPLSSTLQGGVAMPGKDRLPATFVFKTREGGMGVLQITGFSETPPGVKIRYKLVSNADAGAKPQAPPAEKTLALHDWSKSNDEDLPGGAARVTRDGRVSLKIENTRETPLQVRLLTIANPPIKAMRYALSGEIRYTDVQGAAYLETWNVFPEGRYFSRTMGAPGSGPMSQLSGTSDWRNFTLPFDRTGTQQAPTQIEVNLFLPGRGTVFVGPLKLTESETAFEAAKPKDPADEGNDGASNGKTNHDARAHNPAAVKAAQAWLVGIDAGKHAQSWKDAAKFLQTSITEGAWSDALGKARKPFGEMKSRQLLVAQSAKSLPGAPDGEYVVMQFETSFAAKEKAVETVTFMKESDGTWKAAGYFIR